jgi:hypothetical protein
VSVLDIAMAIEANINDKVVVLLHLVICDGSSVK